MVSIFSSGSPAWILLVLVVPGIVSFTVLAVAQYLKAKRTDSPCK